MRERVSSADKLVAAADTYVLPSAVLERWLGLHKLKFDDLMTIIYTSGSTGKPKGVMLSIGNVGSNSAGIEDILQLGDHDIGVRHSAVVPFDGVHRWIVVGPGVGRARAPITSVRWSRK